MVVDGRSLKYCTLLRAIKQGDMHTEWWFGRYVKICNLCMGVLVVLQSYDPTTHFETTVQDVLAMYTRITGKVCVKMRMWLQLVMMVRKAIGCMWEWLVEFGLFWLEWIFLPRGSDTCSDG